MKYILCLLLQLVFHLSNGQQNPLNAVQQSKNAISQGQQAAKPLQSNAELQLLRRTDSLRRELQYYKISENIVLNRLSQVESHTDSMFSNLMAFFTFFVSITLALVGFISWTFFLKQIDKIKEYAQLKLDEQKVLLDDYELKNKVYQYEIHINNGNLNASLADAFPFKGKFGYSTWWYYNIASLKEYLYAYSFIDKSNSEDHIKSVIYMRLDELKPAVERIFINRNNKDFNDDWAEKQLKILDNISFEDKLNEIIEAVNDKTFHILLYQLLNWIAEIRLTVNASKGNDSIQNVNI